MAGTKDNPTIVTNWPDCLAAMQEGGYVKWADLPDDQKVVDYIEITQGYDVRNCHRVDWNGWTVNEMYLNCTVANAKTTTQQTYWKVIFWCGEDTNIDGMWKNVTIKNLRCKHVDVVMFSRGGGFVSSYITCNIDTELDTTARYWSWTKIDGHSDKGENFFPFGAGQISKCDITIYSKNVAPRVPLMSIADSQIHIHYKWDLNETTTQAGILPRAWHATHANFDNCYVDGTIDLRKSPTEIVMPIMRVCDSEEMTRESPSYTNDYRAGIFGKNTVFNLQLLCDENSKVIFVYQNTFGSNYRYDTQPVGLHLVPNNGTEYKNLFTSGGGDASSSTWYMNTNPLLLGDLHNPDYLTAIGFRYDFNTNERFDMYGNEPYIEDPTSIYEVVASDPEWTMQYSPKVNNGIPFLPFYYYPEANTYVNEGAVDELPYITIFDLQTPQDGFTGHGLGVLTPSSCRIVEELNGAYNLTLTHPKDEEGKWQYILEMNVIKALGQLFVIMKVNEVQNGGNEYVSCYAEHISYTLNDRWIFPPVTIAGFTGQNLIDSIIAQSTDMGGDWQTNYTFDITTDLDPPEDFRDWYEMADGVTPYEMLIGSNGFVSRIGGELYRDNFNMSIRERMENADDNAFEMAIGYNLTGMNRTVDLSTWCSYLRGYDVSDPETAYQQWFAVSWDPSTLPRAYPRNVVRSLNFAYEHPEYAMGQLERDTMAFFNQNCAPLVSYELTIKDLKRNPDYKDFTNNYRYKVGDKGNVWDERLKAWMLLEITATEKDGITGECTKVTIGTTRSFTRPTGYVPFVPRPTILIDADLIAEGTPPIDFISGGSDISVWEIHGKSGGVGNVLTGENLYHGALQVQFYNPSNGQPLPSPPAVSNVDLLEVEPNTQYTFSVHYTEEAAQGQYGGAFILEFDANGNFVRNNSGTGQVTATTQSNTKYVRLQIGAQTSYIWDLTTVDDFMFNKGSTAKPYEPHQEGYEIPVTITCGSENNTVKIAIPDKLYENDVISNEDEEYASISFPTYRGACQLTVGTEVQPTVKITYREV